MLPPTTTPGPLAEAYAGVTAVVGPLSDDDLQRPTRCRCWVIADLLFHLLCDAQRALVALASPADGPPDVDAVSYWHGFSGSDRDHDAAARHGWWARRSAAAFDCPSGIVRIWSDTAPAVIRAATASDPTALVGTQGHVLTVTDLVATLVTEAVVHHLDLTVELPDAPGPGRAGLDVATSTMDGLLAGATMSVGWRDTDYLLKATGRVPLDENDRAALGTAAARFPLLG